MKKLMSFCMAIFVCLSSQAQSKDLNELSWNDVIVQAKQEKSVVWYQWYFQERFRETVKAFEAKYGIDVKIAEGSHDVNLQKLIVESRRDSGDIDVVSLSGSDLVKIKASILYGSLSEMLPDGSKLNYDIEGVNNHGIAPAFWGNQTGIAYNPSLISEGDLPQTVEDFANYFKNHPGKFGVNTINGGSGPAFIQSIVRNIVTDLNFKSDEPNKSNLKKLQTAWKWFNSKESNFVLTASNIDSLNRINGGELALAPAWEDQLAGLQKSGEISKNIKFYIPKMKMPGGGNVVAIPKNAKHPAAALLFIQWLTSKETQTELNMVYGSAPQNPDASDDFALVPVSQRVNSTAWANKLLSDAIINEFINKVTLN
jgi:putative spermidine/putrescine transport system substrate-binding protein